jgi:DNA-binding transcriptional LysR family regulator
VTELRLRELELLLAIEEQRSITGAASALGLTQPAASRALRGMEQLLRVHLFERDRSTGMRPTAAGELVIARGRALLADHRALSAEVDAWRNGTGGQLRLGLIPFVSGPLIERLIAGLTGGVLRMSVIITEGTTTDLVDELRLQRLDAVIGRCTTAPLPAGLTQEPLVRQEACLLTHSGSPLVRRPRLRLADLAAYSWLLPPADTPTRVAIDAAFAKASLPPPVATVEAASTKVIHLALRGNPRMLSIVPADVGHDIQQLGGVRRLAFPVPLSMPPVGLIHATRHRDTPVVRNLRGILRDLVSKLGRAQREAA